MKLTFLRKLLSAGLFSATLVLQAEVPPTETAIHSLGSGVYLFDLNIPLVAAGLAANQPYNIQVLLQHPKDRDAVYFAEAQGHSQSLGRLNIGKVFAERALGRDLAQSEFRLAGALTLKLLHRYPRTEILQKSPDLHALTADFTANEPKLFARLKSEDSKSAMYYQLDLKTQVAGVKSETLDPSTGLDGTFYASPAKGKRPAILLVGGSGGFPNPQWVQFILSQGYHVLALRYFSYNPQDPSVQDGRLRHLIDRVPLELFEMGISHLRSKPNVDTSNISFMGESRGGEAGLLMASHFGNALKLRRVITNRPLHFVLSNRMNGMFFAGEAEHSAWTLAGKELPFAPFPIEIAPNQVTAALQHARETGKLQYRVINGLKVPMLRIDYGFRIIDWPPSSQIQLNEFKGQLITVGGSDDGMWPSDTAIANVHEQRQAWPNDRHLIVNGAGHVTYPGILSDSLVSDFGVLFGQVEQAEIDAGRTTYILSGGTLLPNAIYSLLNQYVIAQSLQGDCQNHLLPFADFEKPLNQPSQELN